MMKVLYKIWLLFWEYIGTRLAAIVLKGLVDQFRNHTMYWCITDLLKAPTDYNIKVMLYCIGVLDVDAVSDGDEYPILFISFLLFYNCFCALFLMCDMAFPLLFFVNCLSCWFFFVFICTGLCICFCLKCVDATSCREVQTMTCLWWDVFSPYVPHVLSICGRTFPLTLSDLLASCVLVYRKAQYWA